MKAWRKERKFDFDDEDHRAELQTQTDDGLLTVLYGKASNGRQTGSSGGGRLCDALPIS